MNSVICFRDLDSEKRVLWDQLELISRLISVVILKLLKFPNVLDRTRNVKVDVSYLGITHAWVLMWGALQVDNYGSSYDNELGTAF